MYSGAVRFVSPPGSADAEVRGQLLADRDGQLVSSAVARAREHLCEEGADRDLVSPGLEATQREAGRGRQALGALGCLAEPEVGVAEPEFGRVLERLALERDRECRV